jgi:hypothetical protein
LVDFAVSREEWLSIHELSHDATDGPDINFFTVRQIFRYEEEFWRSVPPGSDIICQLRAMFLVSIRGLIARGLNVILVAQVPGKTKVTNFQLVSFGTDQQVLRFYISVHHVLLVEVVNCLEQLIDEKLDTVSVEAIWLLLENLQQIAVHKFKYKV